jgi:hypothetical protein
VSKNPSHAVQINDDVPRSRAGRLKFCGALLANASVVFVWSPILVLIEIRIGHKSNVDGAINRKPHEIARVKVFADVQKIHHFSLSAVRISSRAVEAAGLASIHRMVAHLRNPAPFRSLSEFVAVEVWASCSFSIYSFLWRRRRRGGLPDVRGWCHPLTTLDVYYRRIRLDVRIALNFGHYRILISSVSVGAVEAAV